MEGPPACSCPVPSAFGGMRPWEDKSFVANGTAQASGWKNPTGLTSQLLDSLPTLELFTPLLLVYFWRWRAHHFPELIQSS